MEKIKILVIQQKMIGDVLTSSIICNNLKLIYPDSQVDYLIYPFTKPVVENNPNIDNLLLFEEKYKSDKIEFFKFLLRIRKSKYDIVIDAYGKIESQLFVIFSGAKIKIGFQKSKLAFIYNVKFPYIPIAQTNAGTAIENRLNLLSSLKGNLVVDNKPKIFLTESEIKNGKKILLDNEIDFSKPIFMISVIGSGETKTYPAKYMAEILDYIVGKTEATLLFNYMPSQKKEARIIFNLCQTTTQEKIKIDVIPGSIREFLSLTYHCNALIGNEGGAVNMAKAIQAPTFTIFSTWINKASWNSFEDEKTNVSVHLKDLKPELYGNNTAKQMKKKAMLLYESFKPELIIPLVDNYFLVNKKSK